MQDLGAVTYDDLKAPVQELLYKFEVYDGAAWINLCALGGLNYLIKDSLSFSSGGAGVSPDPIAGTWSATIDNEDGIFHPRHPTSIYSGLLHTGRKVRISIGGKYDSGDKYWQRLVGYMDAPKFQHSRKTVELSGGDSMKALADTKLASPNDYWGASSTFSSVETTKTFGAEMYGWYDAVALAHEADELPEWSVLYCTFMSVAEVGGGSVYVGQLEKADTDTYAWAGIANVGTVTTGKVYEVSFIYRRNLGTDTSLRCVLYEAGTTKQMGQIEGLVSAAWTPIKFHFPASYSGVASMKFWADGAVGTTATFQIDQLSIREVTARANTRYPMPLACNGVYEVMLDGVPLWYGDKNAGWLYDEANNVFYFDDSVWVETGTNNLVVYYFTTQHIMDVLGDVLAATPLYANRAAALAAMEYTDPGIDIDKVWFEVGTSALEAAKLICERCNYRFWLDEADAPQFKPAPTHGDAVAWFTSRTEADGGDFQDIEEVRNSIVIKGMEQGAFSTAKDKKTSRFTGTASDGPFDENKLEKTHSFTNDLFQDQPTVDAMAATLLAAYKDPKLYSDLPVPKNPIPLERGDTVEWDIELRPAIGSDPGLKNTVRGIIRDASFSGDEFNYKCEMRSTAMNIANYATGPVTVTVEHCRGWALTNSGASGDVQFNLPAAVVGMEITFYVLAAQTLTINPNGTERIAVITGTAGDYLRSDAVIGSCITLVCFMAGYWHKRGAAIGTWSEE